MTAFVKSLSAVVCDVATAPDRAFKAPRWLPVPWSVAIPAGVVVVGVVVGALAALVARVGDSVNDPAAILALEAALVGAALAWPRSRQKMAAWCRLIAEVPLRALTGRWHPDHARIARLERELLP